MLLVPELARRPRRPARTASSSSRTPTATAGSTAARSSATSGTNLVGHRSSASAASGSARPRTCCSSPTATATTSPTARREVVLDGWDAEGPAQRLQRPDLGPRRLALRLQRHPLELARRQARHARRRSARAINCGVWRYHPTRKVFEVVAHGTTNPWGLDFDDVRRDVHHQLRDPSPLPRRPRRPLPADVRPGLQPARLRPDPDLRRPPPLGPASTGPTSAAKAMTPTTDSEAGGGHAHVGAMIYLGDNWPDRVPQRRLHVQHPRPPRQPRPPGTARARATSPSTARTSCSANDPGSAASSCKYGPDGGVYFTDWSDTGECHENDADNAHRENGRVYRRLPRPNPSATWGSPASTRWRWRSWRRARRVGRPPGPSCLREQGAAGKDLGSAHEALVTMLRKESSEACGSGCSGTRMVGGDQRPGSRRLCRPERARPVVEVLACWWTTARPSPRPRRRGVRRHGEDDPSRPRCGLPSCRPSSALPRSSSTRAAIAARILACDDARDPNLPLMVWYGLEAAVPADLPRAARWARQAFDPAQAGPR